MKTMTCRQLGGACDEPFHADTFEELAALSKRHGLRMQELGHEAHIQAMQAMRDRMEDPKAMQEWMAEKHAMFHALPEDETV